MSVSGGLETAATRVAAVVEVDCEPLAPGDPGFVGPYRLVGRLGAGGMGVVFLGEHSTGARAAVKVVRPELAAVAQFRDRFAREMGIASAVRGRFTAPVVGSDLQADQPWVASQYVPGPTLAERVEADGPLDGQELLALASGLVEALAAIHSLGAVHRDLKPSNIILATDGPRVIDFGIAHAMEATSLTQTGAYLGTLAWSSPEQITGEPVGSASDVFAWGLVVAYAATGRHPYGEGRAEAIAYRITSRQPDLTEIPQNVVPAISSALRVSPTERGALDRLRQHLDPRPAGARPVGGSPAPVDRSAGGAALRHQVREGGQALRPLTIDPDGLSAREGLARRAGEAGDAAEALGLYLELLPEQVRVLGADHPYTLGTRHQIAHWTAQVGNSAESVRLYRELLPDIVRTRGVDDPITLTIRYNIAHLTGLAGDPSGALRMHGQLLPDQVRVLGRDHPDTLTTRNDMGFWAGSSGRAEWALVNLRGVLADRVRVLGPDHPNTLTTRHNIAHFTGQAGDPAAAARLHRELLPDRVRVLGPDHPSTLATRMNVEHWAGKARARQG